MKLHTTRGIVLRIVKYGETSLIVTIYTELFGIQSFLVNGVRASSKKGAGKANHSQVQWAAGDAIRQVWLGCILHPGADHRYELPHQKQDKVPRGQRWKTLAQDQMESIYQSIYMGTTSSGMSFSVLLTIVETG